MPEISKRTQSIISSPIRKFLPLVNAAEKEGVKFIKLNVGDPDILPPKQFFTNLRKYRSRSVPYAPSPGLSENVEAWRKYFYNFGVKLEAGEIIPTIGCAEAIFFALAAAADFADEVLVFEPLYTSYKSFAEILGIRLIPVTLKLEDNFILEEALLENKIGKKTKAIVVINPDNPTGKLWQKKEILSILKLAKKHDLFVIGDETYREIRFDGKVPSTMLKISGFEKNLIVCDSVSKRFSLPGARIGAIVSRNREVMKGVLKFAQARLSVGTLEQFATADLLKQGGKYISHMVSEYKKRRNIVTTGLRQIPQVEFAASNGAFYQVVKLPVRDAEDFIKFLIQEFRYKNKSILLTPMADFYISKNLGKNEIRLAYVVKASELRMAIKMLKMALLEYLKK